MMSDIFSSLSVKMKDDQKGLTQPPNVIDRQFTSSPSKLRLLFPELFMDSLPDGYVR